MPPARSCWFPFPSRRHQGVGIKEAGCCPALTAPLIRSVSAAPPPPDERHDFEQLPPRDLFEVVLAQDSGASGRHALQRRLPSQPALELLRSRALDLLLTDRSW
jgi:hypothetical protein